MNELDQIVQQQGYDVAFQLALDKIHAYPTCEMLLYLVTAYLDGALGNMLEIALEQQRDSDAELFADAYVTVSQTFDLPEWMLYQAHLLIAMHKQDSTRCLSILGKMLPAMKAEWNPQDSRFLRHASGSSATALSSKLLHSIQHDLLHDKEYAFIREDPQFDELIAALVDEIEPQP